MCTLLLSLEPDADWPVLIAANRDEMRSREWRMPAAWWPERFPGAVAGRDLKAGGTWLAVDHGRRRVAAVLNRAEPSPIVDRETRTRGLLPLIALTAGTDAIASEDLSAVRPFNLLTAEPDQAVWWRFDGESLTRHDVSPGLHILTTGEMDDMSSPRQARWLPEFRAAARPAPGRDDRAPSGWSEWPELLADVETPVGDPRALNVRRVESRDDYGTVCSSLVAVSWDALKFEITTGPPDRGGWRQVV